MYSNLTLFTIDFAGHFVPYYKIGATVKMIDQFVNGQNWDPYQNTTNVTEVISF